MKIAIQGYLGSFHHLVGTKDYGADNEYLEKDTFEEVFKAINNDEADVGIIAIENTIYGSILTNYDLLLKYRYQIVDEHIIRIKHNLMAIPGQKKGDIKEIRSQSIAIDQCRDYLHENFPNVKLTEVDDTAKAAKTIQENNEEGVAAIASTEAAKVYDLEIIAEEIEDHKQNYTRFFSISKKGHYEEGDNKASIMVELKDEPGSLAGLVNLFEKNSINMTKIESRPIIGRPWNYRFYIDYEVERLSEISWDLIEDIKKYAENIVELGSYEKDTLE
jgi:prephenate dehydratase